MADNAAATEAATPTQETDNATTRVDADVPGASEAKPNGKGAEGQVQAQGDWRSGITDATARKAAEKVTDLNGLALRVVGLEQAVSRSVPLPAKNSKPEEIARFREALNIPEKPDGYEIPKGEKAPAWAQGDEAQKQLAGFAETAQKFNISKDAFKGILDWYDGRLADVEKQRDAADDQYAEESVAQLRKEWTNYDREMQFAGRGLEWVFGKDGSEAEAFKSLKTTEDRFVGDNPLILKMLNKIGRAISEDTMPSFPADAESAKGLKEKLAQLTEQQDDASRRGDHAKARRLDEEIMAVAGQISGDGPITGAMGRTA